MPHTLVIAEHSGGLLKPATASAAAAALQAGAPFDILVIGSDVASVAESAARLGAASVHMADSPGLAQPLADRHAHVIADFVRHCGATLLIAASSTFSKDILPRAAALLDAGMVSEVVAITPDGADFTFKRVLFAGNIIATVRLAGPIRALTIRAAAFPSPAPAARSRIVPFSVDASALPSSTTFVARETKTAGRPDPTEARIVVSGGRAIKSAEDFELLVGGLADVLGAAVGSSRALVDLGITPNTLQIGQTGKVVAPDLYLAIGISGAIQHMAGMKDTKVIAAINKDPDAPIFEIADYGLVADVYEAVPALIAKLRS